MERSKTMLQTATRIAGRSTADEFRKWLQHYDRQVPPHLTYPRVPLYCLLEETAACYPARPCTNFFGKRLTYQQINDLANRFAVSIRKLGVQKGDRVVLLLPNSPQFLIAYYGLLKAGAVIVPLNPLSAERELDFYFHDSEAETAITVPLFAKKVASLRGKTPLKHIIYSGGTTGIAKGIMLSHFNLTTNAHQILAWAHLTDEQGMLAVLPLFHGFGMSVTMNAAVLAGGEIILVPRFSARQVAKTIQKYKPSFFIGVPTLFVALSDLPDIHRYDFRSLRGIFVGAAPLTRAIKENFEAKTGGRMIEGYGLTESVTAIMANPYKGTHKVGSIGLPFPDVDVKIVSLDDGHDLGPGELGEIILKSPTVMLGYYKNPEETQKTIAEGAWLCTGDIGYVDEDGYFYITDRKKELVIVGGFNVFPREIDELIDQHPKVKEGITIGLPDPCKGERIKVYLVLKGSGRHPKNSSPTFKNASRHKVPSEVEFRTALPKSMIGKILRRALREEELREAQEAQPCEAEIG
jgi:long-chain acyl-CoA synthetase